MVLVRNGNLSSSNATYDTTVQVSPEEGFNYPSYEPRIEQPSEEKLGSNASSKMRLSIVHAMEMTVDILVTFGVSADGVDLLRSQGFTNVQDLATLQPASIGMLGHSAADVVPIVRLCLDVQEESEKQKVRLRAEVEGRMRLMNAGARKNTFINFLAPLPFSSLETQNKFRSEPPPTLPVSPDLSSLASRLSTLTNEVESLRLGQKAFSLAPTTVTTSESSFEHGTTLRAPRGAEASQGSKDHSNGTCKPCAWFHHAEGCKHGLQCEFCHLCPAGELKRRKKEKQLLIHAVNWRHHKNHNSHGNNPFYSGPVVYRSFNRDKSVSWFRGLRDSTRNPRE